MLKDAPGDPDQGLLEVLPLTSGPRRCRVLSPRVARGHVLARAGTPSAPRTCCAWCSPRHALRRATSGYAPTHRGRRRAARCCIGATCTGCAAPRLDAGPRRGAPLAAARRRPARLGGALARPRCATRSQGVRDQLSGDTWRGFGSIDRACRRARRARTSHQVAESRRRGCSTGILALQGVTARHDPRPRLAHDRAPAATSSGRCRCAPARAPRRRSRRGSTSTARCSTAVLTAAESVVTHRRRYRGYVRPAGRARAAAARRRTTRARSRSPSTGCARTWPLAGVAPARRGRSACSPTSRAARAATDIAALDCRSTASAGPTSRRSSRRPPPARPARPTRSRDLHFASRPGAAADRFGGSSLTEADASAMTGVTVPRRAHARRTRTTTTVTDSLGIAHLPTRDAAVAAGRVDDRHDRPGAERPAPTTSTATATPRRTSTSPSRTRR